jgi:integrase
MRWNHIEDGGILVTQQKTGERVWIPIHKNLRAAIDVAKAEKKRDDAARKAEGKSARPDAMTILTAARGLPFTAENLKHKFKDAVRAAGLPEDLVFHGLRKAAAVMMAEAGCTTEQIKSITGHRTDDMAAYYARQANQKVLAKAAVRKLERKK